MTTPDQETVEYNILLNAQQALKSLQEFNKNAIEAGGAVDSLSTRVRNFEKVVTEEARKAGVAFEQQLAAFEKLDSKLRSQRKFGVMGNTGGVDPFAATQELHNRRTKYSDVKLSEEYRASSDALVAYNQQMLKGIDLNDVHARGTGKAANEQKNLANATENSAKKTNILSGSINILRMTLSILISSGIFAVIAAFQRLFSMAINGLRELETATYNLVNAERTLSQQGVDITPKGLDETIKKLQEIDPLLSRIQATEVVSRISSLVAPSVGFNAKEIDQLSQSIAVLAVRNKGLGKSFEEVESQVSNAFLSGRVSVGINQLGVKITDQIVKDEALRMGLVKTGDEFDNLTGKMESNIKARAMLSVLSQNTDEEMKHLPEYFKTADAQFTIFQARLTDLMTIIGRDFGPVLITIFDFLAKAISGWIIILEKLRPVIQNMVATVVGAMEIMKEVMGGREGGDREKGSGLGDAYARGVKKAQDSFKEFADAVDTATSATQSFANNSPENIQKASEKMKDSIDDLAKEMRDKLADIERDYRDKLQDIARDYSDKVADINRKTLDKQADAQKDYADKVADINRDTNQKAADAQQDYRQKEIEREQEYQDKLKELRRKFLMDLEDALRERDARAVLKLIRNYQAEKKAAEEANKQKAQQDKQELQRKLQDIEIERQQKLEAARREYEDKLKEIELARQRELAEAATWRQRELRDAQTHHQRQLEEQRIYLQRKLRDLADAIVKEYNLTAAGAQAIHNLLGSYFGAGSSLLSGFANSLTNSLSGAGSNTSTTPTYSNQNAGIGSGLYNPYDIRSRGTGFAEGGTLLATRPTTVTFGERPEIATFSPLSGGANTNKLFTNLQGGGAGGAANITLRLSPDLKAEILESSLENVAVHLERLTRGEG